MIPKKRRLDLLRLLPLLFCAAGMLINSQPVFGQKRQVAGKNSAAAAALTFRNVQRRLIGGRYRQNLHSAYWAASRGAQIVSFLERMIDDQYSYEAELNDPEGMAFPLNALWALAHIRTPRSLRVIENYFERSKDERAGLAIKGFKLRRKMRGNEYGVLIKDSTLLTEAGTEAEAIKEISAGQEVKILREGIKYVSGRETLTYDYVELLGSGQRGYVRRGADNFTPFI